MSPPAHKALLYTTCCQSPQSYEKNREGRAIELGIAWSELSKAWKIHERRGMEFTGGTVSEAGLHKCAERPRQLV
jgi:hypothetical protein